MWKCGTQRSARKCGSAELTPVTNFGILIKRRLSKASVALSMPVATQLIQMWLSHPVTTNPTEFLPICKSEVLVFKLTEGKTILVN